MQWSCWLKTSLGTAAIAVFAVTPLASSAPDGRPLPFRLLADDSEHLQHQVILNTGLFRNYTATAADRERGFWLTAVDADTDFSAATQLDTPVISRAIEAVACPGEHVSRALLLAAEKDLAEVRFTVSALTSSSGHSLAAGNLDLRMVVPKSVNPQFSGNMLVKPEVKGLKAGQCVWLWVMAYVPAETPPGLYRGQVEVTANGAVLRLPVTLRALEFTLPELKNSAGFYIPSHFYYPDKTARYNEFTCAAKEGYACWAFPEFTEKNIGNYFLFWKTRKLNSPTLCHIYNDMAVDPGGNVTISKHEDLDRFIQAFTAAGLNGLLCIDAVYIREWAFLMGRKDKADAEQYKASPAYVSQRGKELFAAGLNETIRIANAGQWPPYRLLVGEEIANEKDKVDQFNNFIGFIQGKVPADKLAILDNDIGYGRQNAVDRGKFYGLQYREYASWTPEALKDAANDQAEVWTYNHGPFRATFGFFQERIGSHGHHQWADQWRGVTGGEGFAGINYTYSIITPGGGILSSAEYERIYEGRNDLAFCQKLKALAKEKPGDSAAMMVLNDIGADIPVVKGEFQEWTRKFSAAELDVRRWRLILETLRLQGLAGRVSDKTAPGLPRAYLAYSANQAETTLPLILNAKKNDGTFTLDAKRSEKSWGTGTGPLKFTLDKENAIRAVCSTPAEAEKKLIPSYAAGWVAYNNQGLCLYFSANHAWFDALMSHQDNDADLWRDNSMECFFQLPGDNGYYQFIVNPKGRKVLVKSGKVITAADAAIEVKAEQTHSDGDYSQEILIPWKLFGLAYAPRKGTVWQLNICRTDHALRHNQSWGRVSGSFHDKAKWGALVFSGDEDGKYLRDLTYSIGLPGKNLIGGALASPAAGAVLELLDGKGEVVARHEARSGKFAMEYRLPANADTGNWALRVADAAGRPLETVDIPVCRPEKILRAEAAGQAVITGEALKFKLDIMVGELSAADSALTLELENPRRPAEKIRLPSLPLEKNGSCGVWLDTSGIKPGEWDLRFSMSGKEVPPTLETVRIMVLPSPYLE